MGDFVLDEDAVNSLVFIAWHTGFAPVRSLIEHAMALEITGSMQLIWMARSKKDRYQDNLCRSWQDAFDNFKYLPLDTGPDDRTIDIASTLRLLNIEPEGVLEHDFYIAGNEKFISNYEKVPGWNFMTIPPKPGNDVE